MNETPPLPPGTAPAGTDPTPDRSFADLRRSDEDRIIGGVCGGAGRHYGIDPVILRVVLAVLCLAGLAGAILYVAGWLFLPDERTDRSLVADWFDLGPGEQQVRTAGLLVGGVLALFAVVGDTGLGFLFWPVAFIAFWIGLPVAAGYWFFVVRPRKADARRGGATPSDASPTTYAPPGPAHASTPSTHEESTMATPTAWPEPGTPATDTPPASWPPPPQGPVGQAPPGPPPQPPKQRRPFSWALTMLTLSVTAIALAATYLIAPADELRWTAYVVVALGVIAAGLLVGTLWGNGGPLIAIGLLLLPFLLVGALVPSLRAGDVVHAPLTASAVESDYTVGAGRLTLDLTEVDDPQSLIGRTITMEQGLGETMIIVPDDLPVTLEADVLAGGVDFLDRLHNGTGLDVTERSDPGSPSVTFDVDQSMGQVTVVRR